MCILGIVAKGKDKRWGECDGCHRDDDCGECVNCLDKKKFGGPGTRKACVLQKCKI